MKEKIKCFIFSWRGQHDNAIKLENQLKNLVDVSVINSDEENKKDHWINIKEENYFSEQFRTALNNFDGEQYDFFFHIQADASYDDWKAIIKAAEESYKEYNWGVFAPNVDDTFYISERTDLFSLNENLMVVANTDNTCWIIHKDMIEEMKNNINLMEDNDLGWGWDLLICAFSHLKNRFVIRDYDHTINHPLSSGYKKDQAEQEMFNMFEKTAGNLRKMIYMIKAEPAALLEYYGIHKPHNDNVFIYDTESR